MPPREISYITDILVAAKLIREFVEGLNQDAFFKDIKCQSAVIRQFEIIGEATKRLPDAFKIRYPHIPWREMAGMRDILVHAYDHVDLYELWHAIIKSIPDLIENIEPFISESPASS